jgi:hypothetical protein
MKKLLSLLCVLATSGTVMPMVVAAAPYQRKEIKLKNNINYKQTNNLEILKRNKRNDNYDNYIGQELYFMNNHSRDVAKINTFNRFNVKNVTIVEKDISRNDLKAGSVFFTTDNGVYLVRQQDD